MTTRDRLFLIVYDPRAGESTVEELGHDLTEAMEVYRRRERELSDHEVVLLGSPSLETLRRTHSSYFGAAERLRPVWSAARS
jgi:hypothetical protein